MSDHTPRDRSDSFAGTERFAIIRKLGSGGMGTVYEAHDRERNARVAIKTVKVRSPELLLRLKREFRSLQDISSPHLVRYGELVQDAGAWFFTMELVEGTNFLRYVWRIGGGDTDSTRDTESPTLTTPSPELVPMYGASVVMPSAGYDELRLRRALHQLGRALSTLHAHGKVHRDVKPSNILVNLDGRVVLVDLGLVLDSHVIGRSTVHGVEGTVAYMAPEQAAGSVVGPPADWYAFGVVLYQALSGRLPFVGTPQEVLAQKQQPFDAAALLPPETTARAPIDLCDLCARLLQTDPADRPSAAEILGRLRADGDTPTADLIVEERDEAPAPPPAAFIGRAAQLTALRDAFDETRRGTPVVVMVRGESGVGKTALVRTFIERLLQERPRTVVLAGRCFERESVPYKALDGVIDALAGHLQRLPAIDAASLRPRRASALLQVFPVLGRVPALRDAPRVDIADPQVLRRRAFEALRELFERLCEGQAVVLLVDDFHWADVDSLLLLGELLSPPSAPALLCIGTWRTGVDTPDGLAIADGITVRDVVLGRLDAAEAAALATQLLPSGGAEVVQQVAREAAGHPLFMGELARSIGAVGDRIQGATLDSVLWRRVQGLGEEARRIVEALSIGEAPVRYGPLAAACRMSNADLEREVLTLQTSHIVRAASERGSGFLDVYHARVREAVRAHLTREQTVAWHHRLAAAFGEADPDAYEARALHHLGAGDTEPGIAHAVQAAERADRALAFDQAARLYEMALAMLTAGDPRRSDLQERLGASLANAGRGFAAAECFRAAMTDAPAERALHLRWLAAEQLVRSGHIEAGLEDTKIVLSAYRLPFPKSSLGTLLKLLLRRAHIAVRLKFGRPLAPSTDNQRQRRFDISWATGTMLAYVDSLRGALVQARGLLLALQLGDQNRLARALLVEAAFRAAGGARSAADSERTRKLATDLVIPGLDPLTDAWVPHVAGICAFLQGRWAEAIVELKRAQDILQSRCTGVAWDTAALSFVLVQTYAYAGCLQELEQITHEAIRAGSDRGDRFLSSMVRAGFQCVVWLAADEPAVARAQSEASVAEWSRSGFHLIHYNVVVGHANIDLYEGKPERSLERIEQVWTSIRNAMFFQFEFNRIEMLELRARTRIALAAHAGDRARGRVLRLAERDLRKLERERSAWAGALARSLRAAQAMVSGRRGEAIAGLEAASLAFDSLNMALHAASARWMLGELDPSGHAQARSASEAYFQRERVRNPAKLAATLIPGVLDTAWIASHGSV